MKPWGWLDGWGVVLVGGVLVAILASADSEGTAVWWLLSHTAAFIWGLPYVAAVLSSLAGLAVVIALVRALRRPIR